jgi:hypothetical protein
MRFEKVRKDNKIQRLIDRFLESEYDKVEVFNEDDYMNNTRMAAALRFVIKNHYKDVVNVSKTNDRVFLYRISQDVSD